MLYLTSANLRAFLKTSTCFGEVRRVTQGHGDQEALLSDGVSDTVDVVVCHLGC